MRSIPEIPMRLVPAVTSAEMAAVDQAMVEDYGIDLIQMMENAGRALAAFARDRFLDGDPKGKTVVVLAGPGGNGGGALVAARRLHGWGATIRAVLAHEPDCLAPVPASPRCTASYATHCDKGIVAPFICITAVCNAMDCTWWTN